MLELCPEGFQLKDTYRLNKIESMGKVQLDGSFGLAIASDTMEPDNILLVQADGRLSVFDTNESRIDEELGSLSGYIE